MIAYIKYRIIIIRYMKKPPIHNSFQKYLVILSYIYNPFHITEVLSIPYKIMTPIGCYGRNLGLGPNAPFWFSVPCQSLSR